MKRRLLAAPLALLLSHASHAHHAFAADYEEGNEGTLTGVVTEVVFKNPHARYYLEVTNEDGSKEIWDLETQNLMMLGRMGWYKDTIKVGDTITVDGVFGRNDTKRMSLIVATLADGRKISPYPSNTRTNVEIYRADEAAETEAGIVSVATNITDGLYELDDTHAYVSFSYSHMGLSNPQLHFADLSGGLTLNGRDMSESSVQITIDAASIESGVAELDDELKSADFFDVANHPDIAFSSTSYDELSEDTGRLHGELTVMGITKPVSLDVTINSAAMNRMVRKDMIGFSATGTIQRSDYGLTAYEQFVSDELALNIQAEFAKAD